jgi:hypothetical protein
MTQPTPPPKEKPKDEGDRSFGVFFSQIANGQCHDEATTELHELLKFLSFQANQKGPKGDAKGRLTIAIALTVTAGGHVGVKYDVTTKEPKPERSDDLFFLTPGKNLTRDNPVQQPLFPREVGARPELPLEAPDDDETSVSREARS